MPTDLTNMYHDLTTGVTGTDATRPDPAPAHLLTFTLPDDVAGEVLFGGMSLDEALEYAQHLNPAARQYLAQRHIGVR